MTNFAPIVFLATAMSISPRLSTGARLAQLQHRLDFGAIVCAPYVLAFVWQCAWLVKSKPLAWTLAIIISAVLWYLYVASHDLDKESLPRSFWLLVALPLLLVYSMRVTSPDISFDVLNYHIFHAERALRGPLFITGDFFPTPAPFNPTPDILTGLYRHLLGYRLGVLVNYLTLIWTGMILNRMLRDYVTSTRLRSASVLFILFTEQILFQINNYMVDLLALPLLLEATRLAIEPGKASEDAGRTIRIALLLGASSAFKLTNLAFGLPILVAHTFNLFTSVDRDARRKQVWRLFKTAPVATLAFVAPLLPFTLYLWRHTGSPVFPLYNKIFKSPYWPQTNVFDPRWGPRGLRETLTWPILIFLKPERMCEFPVYSGRISIGFVIAAVCLWLARRDRKTFWLCFITLSGLILWSAASGYSRYALYLELTSGLVLVWFSYYIWVRCSRFPLFGRVVAQLPLLILLLAQFFLAARYINQYEWSMRETIFTQRAHLIAHESKNFLVDRSLVDYLAPDERALCAKVDVWVETTYKTTALEAQLKSDIPVIGVRTPQYFVSEQSRRGFDEALLAAAGKRMFTLTDDENLEGAREVLAARGLTAGKLTPLLIPYFSDSIKFNMLLVEVLPAWQAGQASSQPAPKGLPLPDRAFKALLSVSRPPSTLRAGEQAIIRVNLKNASDVNWPGHQLTWKYQLTVGDRWLRENGVQVNDLDGRTALVENLSPGSQTELLLPITAPKERGIYILQIDAIQEGVAWFGDKGSEVLILRVNIQ